MSSRVALLVVAIVCLAAGTLSVSQSTQTSRMMLFRELDRNLNKGLAFGSRLRRPTSGLYYSKLDSEVWAQFKSNYSKSHQNAKEENLRRSIFLSNMQAVRSFNKEAPEASMFQLGMNQFGDMTELEMQKLNGFRLPRNKHGQVSAESLRNTPRADRFLKSVFDNDSADVPDEIDWRKTPGRVSAIKNQGACGGCWAFAATGALEGQQVARNAVASGNSSAKQLIELSEQNLIDCVKDDLGCNGGNMADAFDYINTERGIDSEQAYPYEAANGVCRFNKDKSVMTDAGHAFLPEGDEQKLKEAVAKFGPVAVGIDAKSFWFMFYVRGVYINDKCHNKADKLNHAVLVVGYGTDPKQGDYWLVKNSWGPVWGEDGYIRMARNRNNQCGIATIATLPIF